MISLYSQSKFIEKVLTSQTGQQFRVTFLVSFVDGEMKASVVSAIPLQTSDVSVNSTEKVVSLPTPCEKAEISFEYIPSFAPVVSPFNSFDFFTSQPTRAPSF